MSLTKYRIAIERIKAENVHFDTFHHPFIVFRVKLSTIFKAVSMSGYMIFSGTANPELSAEIAKYLDMPLAIASVNRFSDGEINVQIAESVRGKDVFIIQSTCAPANDNLMELLIITDALKRSSAKSITAVVPYFGYGRQDRKAAPRVPISAKLVANLIEVAGITRLVTVDLHASQIQGFFDIPVDNLYGAILFIDYIKSKKLKNPIIASPDIGGVARARYFADRLGLEMVIVDKRREKANVAEVMNVIGNVHGKDVILIDDMIDTAGTMIKGAKALKDLGAISVMACCTHPVLSGPAYERIEAGDLDELVVANTIPMKKSSKKIKMLSTAQMLGEVIRRVHNNESVNSLFETN
jgi:ribose-phosphate pyrophosphokinase